MACLYGNTGIFELACRCIFVLRCSEVRIICVRWKFDGGWNTRFDFDFLSSNR